MSTLSEAVTQKLLVSPLPAALTLEQCAKELHMSTTSFRRKLANDDTSYKAIQTKFLNAYVESNSFSNICFQSLFVKPYVLYTINNSFYETVFVYVYWSTNHPIFQ